MSFAKRAKEKLDRIPLPDGKEFRVRKWHCCEDTYLDLIYSLLKDSPPANAQEVNSSPNARAWKVPGPGPSVFIKFFKHRGLKDKILFFRKSRALRSAEGSLLLEKTGFLVPTLIAQADVMEGLRVTDNILITEWIDGSFNGYAYLETFFAIPLSNEQVVKKRDFLRAVGQVIGKMHKSGIFHGDLRPGNILIQDNNGTFIFYLIDNERNRHFSKGIPYKLRLKNLVQINMLIMPQLTFTDRLRFFKAYIKENPELMPDAKSWITRVFLKTKKRLRGKTSINWV